MAQKLKTDFKDVKVPGGDLPCPKIEMKEEMTLAEAKAYRASLHKPETRPLADYEKREEFRKYWAQAKASFGKGKELEPIIWTHLKAVGMDHPSQFDQGLKHFGLEKVK